MPHCINGRHILAHVLSLTFVNFGHTLVAMARRVCRHTQGSAKNVPTAHMAVQTPLRSHTDAPRMLSPTCGTLTPGHVSQHRRIVRSPNFLTKLLNIRSPNFSTKRSQNCLTYGLPTAQHTVPQRLNMQANSLTYGHPKAEHMVPEAA